MAQQTGIGKRLLSRKWYYSEVPFFNVRLLMLITVQILFYIFLFSFPFFFSFFLYLFFSFSFFLVSLCLFAMKPLSVCMYITRHYDYVLRRRLEIKMLFCSVLKPSVFRYIMSYLNTVSLYVSCELICRNNFFKSINWI